MYYAPHILQVLVANPLQNDEFGRPLKNAPVNEWRDVCRCRCDHNSDRVIDLPDGRVVRPQYKVVCEDKNVDIKPGDKVRCLRTDGSVRGTGEVYNTHHLNYLPYAEIYM